MSTIPSSTPDLRRARREAKDLLAAVRGGDPDARQRLHRPHEPVRLSDAQQAVARAHGYRSWPALVRDVETFAPADLDTLTGSYLRAATLAGGSGFGGDETDWRDARSGLSVAFAGLAEDLGRPGGSVSFLDVGCANGHLGASMVAWGAERGVTVEPFGVDLSPELIERARDLHPQWRDRFWVGDVLDWQHPGGERFDLVHVLLDVLPTRCTPARSPTC